MTKSFSGFQFARRRITLLILPICRGSVLTFPTAKLTKIFENEGVTEKENQSNILRNEKDWLPLHRNI